MGHCVLLEALLVARPQSPATRGLAHCYQEYLLRYAPLPPSFHLLKKVRCF